MKPKSALRSFLAVTGSSLLAVSYSQATTYYWDTNSNTAGSSGGTTASDTWSSGGNTWSTSSTGGAVTSAYTTLSTDDLFFSAGTNATGASAIGLTTTQNAKSLTFEEGTVTISGASGVITLGGTGNITVNSGSSAIIGNSTDTVIGGSVGLTKRGAGTLTLNGTLTNTFTGGINVNNGTLALDYNNIAASTDLVTSQALNFGGGNLTLKGKSTGLTTQSLGNVTVNSGGGTLLIDPNNGTSTTLTLGSLTATAAGGSLTIGKAVTANTGTVAITTTTDKDATGIYGGRIVFADGTANTGYDWATNTGGGGPTYTLSSYGSYSAMSDGTGGVTNTLNSRITASQTQAGNLTTNSLKIENPAASQTLALGSNLLTLTSGGLLVTGTNAVSITGTAGATRLTAGNDNGAYDLVVHQYNSGGLTIGAVIGNNGGNAVTLTKAGTGTLTLSGVTTFTGGLVINGGTVNTTVSQGSGFSGGITINSGNLTFTGNIGTNTYRSTNTLTFAGSGSYTPASGQLFNQTFAGTTINSGAQATLNFATSGSSNQAYALGGLSGSGDLLFRGGTTNAHTTTITLGDASSFTGDISVGISDPGGVTISLGAASVVGLGDGGKISVSGSGIRGALTINYSGSGQTFNTRQLEFAATSSYNNGITINSNGSGALVFNTDLSVTTTNATAKTLTLGGTGTGFDNQFNGVIANGAAPTIGLAKTGASTWVVSNTSNSYNGGTSITGGTLQFSKTAAMPATGLVAVTTGGTLAVNAGAASGEWTNATSGNNSIGGLLAGLGGQAGSTVSWTGAVGLGIDTTNATAGTMTYSGVIGNVGTSLGITKLGTGTLVLDQANTFSGATTVSGGTLALANNLALQNSALTFSAASQLDLTGRTALQLGGLNSSVNLASVTGYDASVTSLTLNTATGVTATYNGSISNGAATNLTLTKTGAGTQILGNNSFTGDVVVNGGTLQLSGTNAFTDIAVNGATLTSGGTDVGKGTLGADGGTITFTGTSTYNPQRSSSQAVLTYNKNVAISSGTTTFNQSTQYYKEAFSGVLSGAGTLVKNDSNGTLAFTNAANTFTGAIQLDGGPGGLTVNSLADSANPITLNGTTGGFNLGGGAGTSSSLVFSSRQIVLGASGAINNGNTDSSKTITINTDLGFSGTVGTRALTLGGSNTGTNAFNGIIGNYSGSAVSLTKSNGGTWNVTDASNSYTGGTIVNGGVLGFASGALGTAGSINASGGTLLWLPGNTQDISARLAMTAATASTFHTNGNDVNFASAIGSSVTTGQLVKTGLGTLTLGGTNVYTGSTTLNAGKLKLDYSTNDTSKLSNTATTGTLLLNGGTLELSGGTHLETVLSTTLNNGGTFITQPTGGATLSMGAITFTGGAIDFAEDSIATTTTGVTNGILSQRATVAGANFAMKSGSNIVAYDYVGANGSTGYTGTAMSANINYALQTAGGANTLSGTTGATTNTLKIANTATGSLAVAANTLTVGAILFTGSADYDITTSGAGKITPSILHNYGTGGATLTLGALGGSLTQFGTGKTVLNTAATTNSTLNINGGTVQISANNQIGTNSGVVAITLNNGTLLASETLALNNAGANSRTITLGAGGGTLAAADTKNLTVSGVISGALNPLTIGTSGNTGTVILSAANTYSGFTNVDAGTLTVASTGTINTTSAINVAAGGTLRYNSSTALAVGPTLAGNGISNRAVLGGIGSINVAVTLDNVGDVLSPGNSPGIQSYTIGQSWASFSYDWEINDFSDVTGLTAGSDFDQIGITGGLTLTGAAVNSYYLNVLSLTAGNITGDAQNFSEINRSWTVLTTTTGITGFDASYWNVDATGFTNGDTGSWTLAQSGNNLVLSYAAVPEPGAAFIGSLGLLALLRRRRH